MAKDKDELIAQLEARLAAIEAQVQTKADALKTEEELEKLREEIARPADVRTQEAADRLWGDKKDQPLFEVCIVTKEGGPLLKDHPVIRLRASSKYEAEGKYKELCGIREVSAPAAYQIKPAA